MDSDRATAHFLELIDAQFSADDYFLLFERRVLGPVAPAQSCHGGYGTRQLYKLDCNHLLALPPLTPESSSPVCTMCFYLHMRDTLVRRLAEKGDSHHGTE